MTDRATIEKQEEKMVHLVRNALLVAGQEMGNGDQWPVIKSTIYAIMKDWENLKIERNVQKEVRKGFLEMLRELEELHDQSSAGLKPDIRAAIKDFQELYDAAFAPVDLKKVILHQEDFPLHALRAEEIIKTLESANE